MDGWIIKEREGGGGYVTYWPAGRGWEALPGGVSGVAGTEKGRQALKVARGGSLVGALM